MLMRSVLCENYVIRCVNYAGQIGVYGITSTVVDMASLMKVGYIYN